MTLPNRGSGNLRHLEPFGAAVQSPEQTGRDT